LIYLLLFICICFFFSGLYNIAYVSLFCICRYMKEVKVLWILSLSKVAVFRLQTAQRLLSHQSKNWIRLACALLNRVGQLNLDRYLFLMNLKVMDLSGHPYCMHQYSMHGRFFFFFIVKREISETQSPWDLTYPFTIRITDCRSLVRAGVHKILGRMISGLLQKNCLNSFCSNCAKNV